MPNPPSSIYHDPQDHVFVCRGCFHRIQIPRYINDGESFVTMRESLEIAHAQMGCVTAMQRLEAASSRGRALGRLNLRSA